MTKAKKGLIITLFAAMMVFAFGATSAFATVTINDIDWADDFSSATYEGNPCDVTYTFNAENGVTTAKADYDNGAKTGYAYFINFTDATLDGISASMSKSKYDALAGTTASPKYPGVKVIDPTTKKAVTNAIKGNKFEGWTVSYDYDATIEEGPATISTAYVTTGEAGSKYDGSNPNYPAKVGTVKDATTTVVAGAKYKTDSWYEIVDDAAVAVISPKTTRYDGTEHTVYAPYKSNAVISYQKWNAKTGAWDAVDAVKYKDAASQETYRAKYIITKGEETSVIYTDTEGQPGNLALTVNGSGTAPKFWWTAANGTSTSGAGTVDYDVSKEQSVNPRQFVEIGLTQSNTGAVEEIPEADLAELGETFDELYTIEVTENKVNANQQEWTIEPVEKFNDALAASIKKHEQLYKNYSLANGIQRSRQEGLGKATAVVLVGESTVVIKDDEINFTNAPNMTYKYKVIKKKAKSFTVAAAAQSGNTVTYTIDSPSKKITINSTTGKIKVAKKLKKGSYKVIVKAHTEAGNGYKAAYAERALTIKIKK